MTQIIAGISDIRKALQPLRAKQTMALVPTMGNLHEGHISLVKLAQQHADIVVVSIFVNPTQFGENEDLDSYPRTLEEDCAKLSDVGANYIFTPSVKDMYPVLPPNTKVLSGPISQQLCGQMRPTHFDGVGLVVAKLFNIIQPNIAVFGKKDYQQLAIVRQLVQDLSYDIDIIGAPIVRAEDGLALSSRNQYLTHEQRQIACVLHQQILILAHKLKHAEATDVKALDFLLNETIGNLENVGFKVDYLKVLHRDLSPITQGQSLSKGSDIVVIAAAWLGSARLLDNQEVTI